MVGLLHKDIKNYKRWRVNSTYVEAKGRTATAHAFLNFIGVFSETQLPRLHSCSTPASHHLVNKHTYTPIGCPSPCFVTLRD